MVSPSLVGDSIVSRDVRPDQDRDTASPDRDTGYLRAPTVHAKVSPSRRRRAGGTERGPLMTRPMRRSAGILLAASLTTLGLAATPIALTSASADAPAAPRPPTKVTGHLLAINDFHGAIDPPTGSGGLVNGVPAGGVEYLAT